jgi:hypothetical protein
MNWFVREKDDYMFLYESYYLFSYIIDISVETSYLTILRPTLEYAAMVCDPTT